MKIRIAKKPGWADYQVQIWRWYWPFWCGYERSHVLSRAHDIAGELLNPVVYKIK